MNNCIFTFQKVVFFSFGFFSFGPGCCPGLFFCTLIPEKNYLMENEMTGLLPKIRGGRYWMPLNRTLDYERFIFKPKRDQASIILTVYLNGGAVDLTREIECLVTVGIKQVTLNYNPQNNNGKIRAFGKWLNGVIEFSNTL